MTATENLEELRFGLIGCGRVAPVHGWALNGLSGARLVAAADIVRDRALNYAAEADAYTDYHDLLARPDVDVVSICTPSGLHAQMGIDAARAGKHIIVEKPIALSLADADALIDAANEAGVKLCAVLQNRCNPPVRDLYDAIQAGKLGKLRLGTATVRWYRTQDYYEDGWHGTWAMDGGAFMNQSIHHIDALAWLMGEPVESVFAYTATLAHEMEAEDAGVAVLRFASGSLGSIEASTLVYPTDLEGSVTILGERGSAKIGGIALNRKVMWKLDGQLDAEESILANQPDDPASVYGASHRYVYADMLAAVRENRPPEIGGAEGRSAVALVLALYESARTGQVVIMR